MLLHMSRTFVAFAVAAVFLASCSTQKGLTPGPGFGKRLQEALIQAKPGSVIEIPEGKHDIEGPLTLTVDNVTLRGKGIDKSVLSFRNQSSGSAGLTVTANGFTIEDMAVEDTKGDGVKVKGGTNVVFRRFRSAWTGGAKETNGSYGIYPVECKDVLIEDSVVKGASDAGFYVGQSHNIVVRRNRAEMNVAGIEIENSINADVYENVATDNAGGILVFNLPDLPMKGGKLTRVYKNQVFSNNHANFAPKGNMVAQVSSGTGVMVLATSQAEVFQNTIKDNKSVNVTILSYLTTGNPIKDAAYDPFTEAVYVHDNVISGGGDAPDGKVQVLTKVMGLPLPSILYDGVVNPQGPADAKICIQNNGDATFANYDAAHGFKKPNKDMNSHKCSLPALPSVTLPSGV
jgi:parallel beta-helix repeat protein